MGKKIYASYNISPYSRPAEWKIKNFAWFSFWSHFGYSFRTKQKKLEVYKIYIYTYIYIRWYNGIEFMKYKVSACRITFDIASSTLGYHQLDMIFHLGCVYVVCACVQIVCFFFLLIFFIIIVSVIDVFFHSFARLLSQVILNFIVHPIHVYNIWMFADLCASW